MNYKQIFKNEINQELEFLKKDPETFGPIGFKCVLKKKFKTHKVWHIQFFEKLTGEQWHCISCVLFANRNDKFKAFNGTQIFEFVNDHTNQQADYLK